MSEGIIAQIRAHRIFLVKAVGAVAVVAGLAIYSSSAQAAAEADASARAEELAAARTSGPGPYATDGTFTGSAEGYGGPVTMQVTVENGWISDVQILDASQEDAAWLDMALVLPERILEAQTTDIDVVSGATFTSTGILNGATEALMQSMEGGAQ